MQSTLYALAESAAKTIAATASGPVSFDELQPELTILYDAAMNGTLAGPDLRGFDPRRRALLVAQGNRSAWVFNPEQDADAVLKEVARLAEIKRPNEAGLYSLRAQASRIPASVAQRPRASAGAKVRPPAVAGSFYPADPKQLAEQIDGLFPASDSPVEQVAWRAAMVPHAGLVYSGRIAADVLRRIEIPPTVVVIGPKHTALGVDWAIAPHATWSLPGASLDSDPDLAQRLAAAIDGLELDAAAHAREHAVEVELPLLARLAPQSKVVGIAIGAADFEQCEQIAGGLANVLQERGEPVLLVISTDMNHFASDAENRRLDELALEALETLDPRKLYQTVRDNHISMCGMLPCVIVMLALKKLGGLSRSERVAYATTADVTGDKSRVVGYAGMLLA